MAAPIYPLESLYGPGHRFNWITLHESYTKWLDSYGPSILHVHGTAGVSDASEYIFQCLDAYRAVKQDNEIILYFTFNRHDDRCNSVVAMLNTLLAQIIAHNQNLYTAVRLQYEQMSLHRGWTQTELLLCFRNILSYWNHDGILCVINGLDECDGSRKAFLEDICSHASLTERRFKIAITSTTDSDLQTALADWPTIDLDDWPQHSDTANTNPASDIGLEVLKLMQQRPVFCGFEKTITDKLLECKQDKHWHRLVLHQLRLSKSPSTKSAAQREVDLLPSTTPKDLFTRILARVPSERWSWARKALNWILYAFHPLSIRELGVALALEIGSPSDETIDLDELVYQDVAADLDEVFRGMFIVKHNGVYFGHPEAQEFLLAADAEQAHVWYDVKETAHREISNACLLYLSSQQVQYPMAMSNNNNPPADPLESPTFIPRYNLRDYAIKYWSRHYKLIPETFRPTERALEFVQDTKIMHCWAEAYWWSSNSISRTDRVSLSLLPILAGLGLQDLVTEWLDLDGEMPKVSQDRAFALAEAARNAHVQVVRRLLQHNGYSQANLQDALTAGASCCDEAVLDELISYAAESIENFKWPPVVLCRAAQLGLENVVKKLLESGAPTDTTTFTVPDMTPLHYAARQGHAGVVKILLERKASVTVLAAYDRVPLHTAAFYGHATIVKLLLDAGADVNVVDADETNAILLACTQGNYKAVEILAGAGCDMGCDKQGEWTPLLVVANEGFINSARYLLEKAANTEVEGRENWTPLRHAALNSHMELCRLLLDNGAITNTLSGGAPILGESAGNGNLEVVKLLVENGAAVDAVTAEGLTALQKASQNGHLSVVTELLDRGADINHTDDEGETSILLAARYGFAQTVQLLIDRGANLHLATKDDWTPIHISYDHAETTRILMENGADANRLWSFRTPLYLAASWNCIEVVKVLLSFNPNLEIRCLAGNTALTIATTCSHTDIVRLLLEAGANVNHKDETNNSALHYAVSDNREDILRTLMEYHPYLDFRNNDGDTALHCIAYSTSLAIAKLLINGGSDLETRNKECNTPLCQAVMVGNLDIVKYLIAKKAELNIIGGKYGGPLHIACRWLNLELVKLLVEAGADVNLVDPSSAGTPIQSACHCWNLDNWKGAQEHVIRYLINEAKADVATVGGLQGCALNVACGWSTPEMVKLLLENGAKVDVVDEMGRTAVHFAATQTLEHFQPTLDAGADVEQRDAIGRTSLHWAVLSGKIDVVERVLSLSRCLVDQADIDGWTPLLWVAKGCGVEEKQARSNAQVEIIKLLLDRGANPCVRGKGLDQEWSPVKVARYHGADDVVVQLLMAKAKERLAAEGKENSWDEAAHTSEKAFEQMADCDGCLLVCVLCCPLYSFPFQPPTTPDPNKTPVFHPLCTPADIGTKRPYTVSFTSVRPAWTSLSATSATYLCTCCTPITPSKRAAPNISQKVIRMRTMRTMTTLKIVARKMMTLTMTARTMMTTDQSGGLSESMLRWQGRRRRRRMRMRRIVRKTIRTRRINTGHSRGRFCLLL